MHPSYIGRITHFVRPSVCLSARLVVWATNLKKKRRKIKIGVKRELSQLQNAQRLKSSYIESIANIK